MNEVINEKVSVITSFDKTRNLTMPRKIRWQGRDYLITKLAYHHKIRRGRNICHIFHVTDGSIDFCLNFDSDSLQWVLQEVTDGTTT